MIGYWLTSLYTDIRLLFGIILRRFSFDALLALRGSDGIQSW